MSFVIPVMSALAYPVIDPILFEVGPFALRWYSLGYIGGLLAAWFLIGRMMESQTVWGGAKPPANKQDADDMLLWAAAGVILGGRIGYVLFYNFAFYLDNPSSILQVWNGGMSFHGGFLGVVLGMYLFTRKRGIDPLRFGDAVAAVSPIGIFLVRIANFINGELYGRVTDVGWGMVFPHGGDLPRHPSQLYEAGLEGLLLGLIMWALVRAGMLARPGLLIGVFFLGYSAARMFVELFREPDAHIGFLSGGATMGQLLSAPMVLIGLVLVYRALKSPVVARS